MNTTFAFLNPINFDLSCIPSSTHRLDRMFEGKPLFCDITWHPKGNPAGHTETSSIEIAKAAVNYCGLDTMLHMTCVNNSKEAVNCHLNRVKDGGIRNILALRGGKFS